jgi:hypothetical protein
MLSAAILCNVVLFLVPLPEPAAGPTVTALEIVDLRRASLKSPKAAEAQRFSFDRPGLKLVVEVQGEDVARASHFGMFELEAAVDNTGDKLKLSEDALGFHDFRKEFVAIDRSQMFIGEDNPPKDVIRIELPLESPARAAATISLRGKLQLKKVETVDVLIPATPGDVKHEQLEKAGLKLKIVKSEDPESFAYEVSGKLDLLNEAQIVDAQGKPIETRGSSSYGSDESLHRDIYLEKPVPADAKLKLALVTKAENVPVTFELKDVKLP